MGNAAPLDLLMDNGALGGDSTTRAALLQKFDWKTSLVDVGKTNGRPLLVTDSVAGGSMVTGRGARLTTASTESIAHLQNTNDFLLVAKGAQIDYGVHANRLS